MAGRIVFEVETEAGPISESAPARPSAGRHREVLVLALAIVILAGLMEVRADQRVYFRGWPSAPVPELCLSRSWFGMTCPGCGLTRGMIHVAHADWPAALRVQRLSLLFAVTILFQIPYRIYCLRTGRLPFGTLAPRLFGIFLIAALAINWMVGLVASNL